MKDKEGRFDFNGYVESGALSGSSPTIFLLGPDRNLEDHQDESDQAAKEEEGRKVELMKNDSSRLPS